MSTCFTGIFSRAAISRLRCCYTKGLPFVNMFFPCGRDVQFKSFWYIFFNHLDHYRLQLCKCSKLQEVLLIWVYVSLNLVSNWTLLRTMSYIGWLHYTQVTKRMNTCHLDFYTCTKYYLYWQPRKANISVNVRVRLYIWHTWKALVLLKNFAEITQSTMKWLQFASPHWILKEIFIAWLSWDLSALNTR